MKLTVEEISERVSETTESRTEYVQAAAEWERMWSLKLFKNSAAQMLDQYGQEQVTLPTPYNVVHLARRLIATEPRIEVPSMTPENEADEAAEKRERWLTALWQRINKQQRRDILADVAWQALVRGRFCLEVKWVKNVLPEGLRKSRLPIMIRTLDPIDVGIKTGPLWTEYAYHKYEDERLLVQQRYPKIKKKNTRLNRYATMSRTDKVEVVDFWYTDPETGKVWNAVVVDDEFATAPWETDYTDIPIVEGYGDSAPISQEELKSLSILHPLRELWPYQCRLASQIGTGLLYYFWPAITVQNEQGAEVKDIEVRPGVTTTVPAGTKIEFHQGNVNMPLAQTMMGLVDSNIQMGTFPGVMYGNAPGELQAGYGISILADQARGRVQQFRQNMETCIEHVNEIVLALVESESGPKGVTVWGKDNAAGRTYHETLKAKDIDGFYENMVNLAPPMSTDDMQRQMSGMKMVQDGIISKRTYRDKFLSMAMPSDEQLRIELQNTIESPEMKPKVMARVLQQYFPNDWEAIVAGTPVEQVIQAEQARKKQQEEAQEAEDGEAEDARQFGRGGPGGPGGMPPGGLPPGMLGPGGPMPPPGMPPGMPPGGPMPPPGMMAQPLPPPPGGLQPGVQPNQLPPGMGDALAGTGLGGPPVMQLPPEMMGQPTPEALGMQGMPPGMYQELVGEPYDEEEQMMRAAGIPPGMR